MRKILSQFFTKKIVLAHALINADERQLVAGVSLVVDGLQRDFSGECLRKLILYGKICNFVIEEYINHLKICGHEEIINDDDPGYRGIRICGRYLRCPG